MTKFFHIVQVHPVENGAPNFHKVKAEHEFESEEAANIWVKIHNAQTYYTAEDICTAVYVGMVNDETGELVV